MVIELIMMLSSIELGLSTEADGTNDVIRVTWGRNGDLFEFPKGEVKTDKDFKRCILEYTEYELKEDQYSEVREKLNELKIILTNK